LISLYSMAANRTPAELTLNDVEDPTVAHLLQERRSPAATAPEEYGDARRFMLAVAIHRDQDVGRTVHPRVVGAALLAVDVGRERASRRVRDGVLEGRRHRSRDQVDQAHQQRLTTHSDEAIRERAQRLFVARNANRRKVIKDYAGVKELTGNTDKGVALFRQSCMISHRLKGEGNNIGPDLGTVADKSIDMLLVAILDPNEALEAKYVNYTAVIKDGREASGVIAAETPNSVTIRNAGGVEEVILRPDIKELKSSGVSLMPEGFENGLTPQDMADLIAYIRSN
jgi:putative heme-binding domain-containing protein